MKAVVDASFLLTLLPGDADQSLLADAYPSLREELEFVSSALLAWETGNTIHGRRRQQFGSSTAERKALHRTLLEGIRLEPLSGPLVGRSADLAEDHGLTFYDASYLALAASMSDAVLLTQDRRLLVTARQVLPPMAALDVPGAAERFGAAGRAVD